MGKYLYIILFILSASTTFAQQLTPLYSLHMYNKFVINPAVAGTSDVLNFAFNYRDQWATFEGHPVTFIGTVDTPLRNRNFGIGSKLFIDRIGPVQNTEFTHSVSYKFPLVKNYFLSVGGSAGISSKRIDYSQLTDDVVSDIGRTQNVAPTFGAGAYLFGPIGYVGVALPSYRLKTAEVILNESTIYLTAGLKYRLYSFLNFCPSVLTKFAAPENDQSEYSAIFEYNNFISAGVTYRNRTSFIYLAQIAFKQLSIGYSYDYDLKGVSSYTNGSNEILLRYQFKYEVKVMDPRTFK